MTTRILCKKTAQILSSALLGSGILVSSLNAHANSQRAVSQAPLNLVDGVAPNMIITIDESTSMDRAYVPDGLGFTGERRFRANSFNAMYYNPDVTYRIPPSFKKDGTEQTLSTLFTEAPYNGFKPKTDETLDLSSKYSVATEVRVRDSSSAASIPSIRNPEPDFRCGIKTAALSKNGQTHTCTGDPQNGYSTWNGDELDSWQTRTGEITITRTGSSSCTAVMKSGDITINNVPCTRSYISGTYYYLADLTKTPVPAYYYVADKTFGADSSNNYDSLSADGSEDNADCKSYESCYRLVFVTDKSGKVRADDLASGTDERQNFANWYSFYRSRSLATISAASLAFYNLSTSTRMTWQNLSDCTNLNKSSASRCGNNLFREYSKAHRGEFYHWMQNMRMNNSTPLRLAMDRAGKFLRNDDAAWQAYPNDSSKTNTTENTYACRSSYHVLMTDGMWNGDDANTTGKTYNDDKDITLPTGSGYTGTRPTKYAPSAPYQDSNSNTLADVAMNYWAMDLNSDLPNTIKPYMPYRTNNDAKDYWDPRNNPADWQHMSNFIMGLGMTNSLTHPDLPWQGGTYLGDSYKKLYEGTVSWPKERWTTSGSADAWKVYDLWHAAINSRGEFFSVESPDAMVRAFNSILARIADRKSSATSAGTSSATVPDGLKDDEGNDISQAMLVNYSYQSTFDSSDWSGDIKLTESKRELDPVTKEYQNVSKVLWSAKEELPPHSARKIYIAGSGTSNNLIEFKAVNAGNPNTAGTLANYLNINPEPTIQQATWQDRLNFIRGDQSKETTGGDDQSKLRSRNSILGDFLSSQPVAVQTPRYLEGLSNKLEGNDAYSQFMEEIKNRPSMVYVGGNDGMLHAFDGNTGEEKFAFIPTAVFPKLSKLTGIKYSHEYYVDGTPVVADAYNKEKNEWRTLLIGTLKAGGSGLFALDITKPDEIKLLWELHDQSAAFNDKTVKPGYSFSKPTVARLHNGKWAVVTGNGYKGEGTTNGAAALYIIDAFSGELIKSLEVQSPVEEENGLSTPLLVDINSDGVDEYAYAGDLHGNLWRFDLLGTGALPPTTTPPTNGYYGSNNGGTENFKVSYGGQPMFSAKSGTHKQAITTAPTIVRHPTRKGYIIIFGTGQYFEIGHKTPETNYPYTLYGIWDEKTKAEPTSSADPIEITDLKKQKIESSVLGHGQVSGLDLESRIVSNETVEWYKDHDISKGRFKRGWYLDFTASTSHKDGEMMIADPKLLGAMVLVSTLVPNDDPCANGSSNWTYAINPATGGRTTHHAFDIRGEAGEIVSAIRFGTEGGVSLSQNETGFNIHDPANKIPIYPPHSNLGRQTWRMIQNP